MPGHGVALRAVGGRVDAVPGGEEGGQPGPDVRRPRGPQHVAPGPVRRGVPDGERSGPRPVGVRGPRHRLALVSTGTATARVCRIVPPGAKNAVTASTSWAFHAAWNARATATRSGSWACARAGVPPPPVSAPATSRGRPAGCIPVPARPPPPRSAPPPRRSGRGRRAPPAGHGAPTLGARAG